MSFMEYLAVTVSILGLIASLIAIFTTLAKIYKPIIMIQCDVKKMSERYTESDETLKNHEERIRHLEIKSANCKCSGIK